MLTGIILAGGKSSRMGEDKAFLRGGVTRLAEELRKSGCDRIIVMCGSSERKELFSEECVIDQGETLAESLMIVLSKLQGEIQIAPCDAIHADAEFFSSLNGVPLDQTGNRQPLLARFLLPLPENTSNKISDIFKQIPSCEGGIKASNANYPRDLRELN